jgi:hypothetical protein
MDAMLLFIGFVLGWVVGAKITAAIHVMSFKKIMEELNISDQQLKKMAEANGIKVPDADPTDPELEQCEIRIEQVSGQLYAYRKDNNHFLGQGTDRDSLIERLKSQFRKDTRLVITEEDGAEYIKQRG